MNPWNVTGLNAEGGKQMERKTLKVLKLVVILLWMLAVLGGCVEREPIENEGVLLGEAGSDDQRDLRAYFPAQPGMTYQYAGEGNEYATFTRTVKYVDKPYAQVYDDNGGTVSVTVYELQNEQIIKVFSQGEFNEDKNILGEIGADKVHEDIILKSPIQAGTTWESAEWKREIVDPDVTVTVPAGTFYHVVKVKATSTQKDNTTLNYEYYAENVGLVQREYKSEGFEVTSKLSAYGNTNATEKADGTAGSLDTASEEVTSEAAAVAAMRNPNLPLLAYQLEYQLRSAFRAAYESYVNMKQFSAQDQKQFDQILALYRADISTLATNTVVDEQLQRLQEYYEAGQAEVSFPNHEVVQAAKLLSQTPQSVKVGISVQKYYQEKDWNGRSVDQRGDYIVELTKTGLIWKVASVEEAD